MSETTNDVWTNAADQNTHVVRSEETDWPSATWLYSSLAAHMRNGSLWRSSCPTLHLCEGRTLGR